MTTSSNATSILLMASLIGAFGCANESQNAAAPHAVNSAAPEKSARSTERLRDIGWDDSTRLPSGEVSFRCDRDWGGDRNEPPPTRLEDISEPTLLGLMLKCDEDRKITNFELTYKGEIDAGFAELIRAMNEIARRFEVVSPKPLVLLIDSGGGDVAEAMKAGDLMSKAQWHVIVPDNGSCYSACVLVLAAATRRAISNSGSVGIHRMIPAVSSANSREELNDELAGVHAEVGSYLVKNGVARTVADLMMSIPAGDIRVLTRQELKDFGLWWRNPAQADLARLAMIRRCGQDYVTRRDTFIRLEKSCHSGGLSESDLAAYSSCLDSLAERLALPDPKCPELLSSISMEAGPN